VTCRSLLAAATLAAVVALTACGDADESPGVDAARTTDAAWDAGSGDANDADAGADADVATMSDGAVADATELDAAMTDAAVIDAGVIDAAMIDAAMIDAAMIDAAMIDAGVIDARLIDAMPIVDAMPIDAPGDIDDDGVTDDLDCAAADPTRFAYRVTYTDLDGDGVGAGPRAIQCLGTSLPPGRQLGGYDDDDLDAAVIESEESEDELLDLLLD
jgi:hypothetical protein